MSDCPLGCRVNFNIFYLYNTFSTKSLKTSLTSLLWIRPAAIVRRPRQRFYRETETENIQGKYTCSVDRGTVCKKKR